MSCALSTSGVSLPVTSGTSAQRTRVEQALAQGEQMRVIVGWRSKVLIVEKLIGHLAGTRSGTSPSGSGNVVGYVLPYVLSDQW